jgi:hypothetical protein
MLEPPPTGRVDLDASAEAGPCRRCEGPSMFRILKTLTAIDADLGMRLEASVRGPCRPREWFSANGVPRR